MSAEPGGAISEPEMSALRCAAALVHAVPHVRLRFRDAERVVLEVDRAPAADGRVVHANPCRFRRAVCCAYARSLVGRPLRFLDLPGGAVPAIDVGVPSRGRVLPGGLVRLTMGPILVHVVAVALPEAACRNVLTDASEPAIGFHPDDDLQATLLYVGSRPDDACGARAAREMVETAVARCTVALIEDHLVGAGAAP